MAKRKTISKNDENSDISDEDELKNSVEILLKVMLEQMEEEFLNESESFESYSKRAHLKLYKDIDGFCDRFLKGYEVIVNEINANMEKKS